MLLINTQTMLILYYKPTCPYCQQVLGEAERLQVAFDLKNVSSDDAVRKELIDKGGKSTVPFLVDTERGVSIYESEDIIAYLEEHYGNKSTEKSFGGLRIHRSEESCDTCQ